MPSTKDFSLVYDALNSAGTFSEGDTLTGKVIFTLGKDTKVKNLFVKVKGDANVRWTEGSGDDQTTYSAHRRYFKLKQYLIQQDTTLPKGVHRFNFRFKIPMSDMPSSFKGIHGKIVYMLEAKLSRSWHMDKTVQTELNFVSRSYPSTGQQMEPQVGSVGKELGLISKGMVQMTATIDRGACFSGETVTVVVKVNNSSSKKVTPKFILNQKVVYYAKGSTNSSKKTVCAMMADAIAPKTEKTLTCPMKIPLNQAQTINNCDILTVNYYLKVYLDISFAFDPEVNFLLVILPPGATVPLQPFGAVGGAVGPNPPGAFGGPSNSDFPPPFVPAVPYPVPPGPGADGYPAAPGPAQPSHMRGGYSNQMPQPASSYGPLAPAVPSQSVHNPFPSAPPVFQQGEAPPSYVSIFPTSNEPHTLSNT
ncbi:arrestin domain-containing protein 3-like [Myripristis murdjan]|uniref:arrestin domain-containing protein 3-like n=1 Tax=Myripristis murdjan TaxID=586833 RepID=UPI001175E0C7|nr:arrestin domain-containing protein 3-like [Myripristis murdjan]